MRQAFLTFSVGWLGFMHGWGRDRLDGDGTAHGRCIVRRSV